MRWGGRWESGEVRSSTHTRTTISGSIQEVGDRLCRNLCLPLLHTAYSMYSKCHPSPPIPCAYRLH